MLWCQYCDTFSNILHQDADQIDVTQYSWTLLQMIKGCPDTWPQAFLQVPLFNYNKLTVLGQHKLVSKVRLWHWLWISMIHHVPPTQTYAAGTLLSTSPEQWFISQQFWSRVLWSLLALWCMNRSMVITSEWYIENNDRKGHRWVHVCKQIQRFDSCACFKKSNISANPFKTFRKGHVTHTMIEILITIPKKSFEIKMCIETLHS